MAAFQMVATTGEELHIPSGAPHSLKAKLWTFARALREHGEAALADSIQVCPGPSGVTLRHRSSTIEAREVAAALAAKTSPDADSFFDKLPERAPK